MGNAEFAGAYDAFVPNTFRFVNDGDIVTGFPKYQYVPEFLGWTYKHVGNCVVVDKYGDLIINPVCVRACWR